MEWRPCRTLQILHDKFGLERSKIKVQQMQKVIIGVLAVATAALSVVCGVLLGELRTAKRQTQAIEQARVAEADAREAQAERVKELERSEARLERQLQDFSKVTTKLRSSESVQSSNLTKMAERLRANKAGKGGADKDDGAFGKGMGDMLNKMMKDPAMRDVLREQQKAMLNIMYSGLFKELNLSPEEKDQFKTLLTDAQMKTLESAQRLFGGDTKEGGEDASKLIADAKKKTDEDIKALLGEERFAKYEDYQKNMSERMQLDSFSKQLSGSEALREEQSAKLMQIMKEEKAAIPPVIPNDQTQMPKKESFTPENIERQEQWLKDYNERVAKRAQELLTPEQFNQWVAHQKQQADMATLGMKMASSMFGGKAGDTAPAK
jgi:hypothetical protein